MKKPSWCESAEEPPLKRKFGSATKWSYTSVVGFGGWVEGMRLAGWNGSVNFALLVHRG